MKLTFIECSNCMGRNTYTKALRDDSRENKFNQEAILACSDCNFEWEGLIGRPEIIEAIKPQVRAQAGVK